MTNWGIDQIEEKLGLNSPKEYEESVHSVLK